MEFLRLENIKNKTERCRFQKTTSFLMKTHYGRGLWVFEKSTIKLYRLGNIENKAAQKKRARPLGKKAIHFRKTEPEKTSDPPSHPAFLIKMGTYARTAAATREGEKHSKTKFTIESRAVSEIGGGGGGGRQAEADT